MDKALFFQQATFEPEDIRVRRMLKDDEEDQIPQSDPTQIKEESHTTRNAFICVVVVVVVCVIIWYNCDPYGVNGSEGVELEGELPWYKKIINKVTYKIDQMGNKTPQFTKV